MKLLKKDRVLNGGKIVESFSKAIVDYDELTHGVGPVLRKPLLLYLASSPSTIEALIVQEDGRGH